MAVTSDLIAHMASALQDIRLEPVRAAELAREVDRLNRAILADARHLAFDDDPAVHVAVLAKPAPR
jgi:hypothetical protein